MAWVPYGIPWNCSVRPGTFLAAVAAVVSVSSIVLDETARAGTALLISFCWGIGATMQIAAGIIARMRSEIFPHLLASAAAFHSAWRPIDGMAQA